MVTAKISKTLYLIDRLYNKPNSNNEKELYSKQALIELCGWIENEEDRLILKLTKKFSGDVSRVQKIIKKNYSFKYSSFQEMLRFIIGDINLNRIEKKLQKDGTIDALRSLLSALKKNRDDATHNDLGNKQETYLSPSVIIQKHNEIKEYFKAIEDKCVLLSFKK